MCEEKKIVKKKVVGLFNTVTTTTTVTTVTSVTTVTTLTTLTTASWVGRKVGFNYFLIL